MAYGSRLMVRIAYGCGMAYGSRLWNGLRFETYGCGMAYGCNGSWFETYGCGMAYGSRLTVKVSFSATVGKPL